MTADASRPIGHSDASGLASLSAAIDALHPLLHAVEVQLAGAGVPVAHLYVTSARSSLSHASRQLARYAGADSEDDSEIVEASGILLRPEVGTPWVGVRHRLQRRSATPEPDAELAAWAYAPDLGSDLLRSPAAEALCAGPVGAALLFRALAHERWIHRETAAKWSTDASGARALVSALSCGMGFPSQWRSVRDCLVDRKVLAVAASLGWSRLFSPELPRSAHSEG